VIREEFEQEKGGSYREPEYVLWLENELIEARKVRDTAISILDHCLPGWAERAQAVIDSMREE
jgi:hypothetical protein